MLKQYLPWGLLVICVIVLLTIGIKSCNKPDIKDQYLLQLNEINAKLQFEKIKTDSLSKQIEKWETLYQQESEKPKKIIIRINEKVDSIKHLPTDSALKYFQQWSKLAIPQVSK